MCENLAGADSLAGAYSRPSRTLQEDFKGVGIVFDTYDNDGKRDNPAIMAVSSDGDLRFDHDSDGGSSRLANAMCKVSLYGCWCVLGSVRLSLDASRDTWKPTVTKARGAPLQDKHTSRRRCLPSHLSLHGRRCQTKDSSP